MIDSDTTYYDATCTKCGEKTQVPFKPIEGRDLFCKSCYKKVRNY